MLVTVLSRKTSPDRRVWNIAVLPPPHAPVSSTQSPDEDPVFDDPPPPPPPKPRHLVSTQNANRVAIVRANTTRLTGWPVASPIASSMPGTLNSLLVLTSTSAAWPTASTVSASMIRAIAEAAPPISGKLQKRCRLLGAGNLWAKNVRSRDPFPRWRSRRVDRARAASHPRRTRPQGEEHLRSGRTNPLDRAGDRTKPRRAPNRARPTCEVATPKLASGIFLGTR